MIYLIGPVPPPVHGASIVTARAAEMLAERGIPHLRFSTSPRLGSRGGAYHLSRIAAYLRSARFVFGPETSGGAVVYLSLAGGLGLFYDLFERDGIVFAERFGHVFDQVVGKLLASVCPAESL